AGCISAEIAKNDCESAALGAMIGEMWADRKIDNPNTLTDKQRQQIINESRLTASFAAFIFDKDINTAADMASEVVRWNSTAEIALGHEWNQITDDTDGTYAKEQLQAIKGALKDISDSIMSVHQYYNDMILINVSGGVFSYTLIINSKNGKVYRPELFEVTTSSTLLSGGASVNFGSITGGFKNDGQIDRIILGSSVGFQGCYGACVGVIKTQAKDTIITYGLELRKLEPQAVKWFIQEFN
ncbi:hypothetical protein SAMN02745664_1201, partial [Moraxella cuniculi DSM 21768]